MTGYGEEEPIAVWEAAFLDWDWEAYEKEDDGVYYGRVKSSLTYDNWEWGYFTEEQLRTAGAYRTDEDDEQKRFPDGGYHEDSLERKTYEMERGTLSEDDGGDD